MQTYVLLSCEPVTLTVATFPYPLYAAGGQLRREGAARVLPPRDGCVDLVPVIIEFLHQNAVRPRPAEISS